jgi:hypothetical protein
MGFAFVGSMVPLLYVNNKQGEWHASTLLGDAVRECRISWGAELHVKAVSAGDVSGNGIFDIIAEAGGGWATAGDASKFAQ